jgi:hypothetical protein
VTPMPSQVPRSRSWRKCAGWVVLAYLLLLLASLPFVVPPLPNTRLGWALLLVFAPAAYLLGEWVAGNVDGSWWERHPTFKAIKFVLYVLVGLFLVIISGVFAL